MLPVPKASLSDAYLRIRIRSMWYRDGGRRRGDIQSNERRTRCKGSQDCDGDLGIPTMNPRIAP